jgi:YbgC/YbaW family acyl-CoA thioester hydrolase
MSANEVDLTVFPDECDAFGHLNQASFLSLFERARWTMLERGPGMDVFTRNDAWPAVRKTTVEYHASALPGDVLRFQQALTYHGRTSFTMRQVARRVRDDALVASAEFVFVTIDRDGRALPVPAEVSRFMLELSKPGEGLQRMPVNGVSLAVDLQGSGPAVVFLHGYALDHSMWRHQMANLAGYRRIAADLRGMGHSDAPDLGYSMATYADDVIALLDQLGVKQAVLVGLSMGGYVAFEVVRRFRHRVRGLVLMDTRADPDTVEVRRQRDVNSVTARDGGSAAIAEHLLPRLLGRTTLATAPQTVERVRALMAKTSMAGIIGALGAMRDRPDSTPLLAALGDIPTLVVAGAEDQISPPAQMEAMAATIPGATFRVIADAGHLPPVEQPLATTRLLAEFLDRLQHDA